MNAAKSRGRNPTRGAAGRFVISTLHSILVSMQKFLPSNNLNAALSEVSSKLTGTDEGDELRYVLLRIISFENEPKFWALYYRIGPF